MKLRQVKYHSYSIEIQYRLGPSHKTDSIDECELYTHPRLIEPNLFMCYTSQPVMSRSYTFPDQFLRHNCHHLGFVEVTVLPLHLPCTRELLQHFLPHVPLQD